MNSHALFFKDNITNHHLPITDTEIQHLKRVVAEIDPDMIGISVLTPYVPAARRVVAALRQVCDAPILAGGKHPTISPEEALTYGDYACKGEGELVLLDVFERLRRGEKDFSGLAGLWHRDSQGVVVDQGQRRLIQDLDLLPFEAYGEDKMWFIERDTVQTRDPELDEQEILLMAGRGCVYVCSYCVNALLIPMNKGNGRFIRLRSPDNVIAQVEQRLAKQSRAAFVSFNDEVFGVFDDWTQEFATKYTAKKLPPFNCELVPKLIKERNIRPLVQAGLYEMHFGIQSGSDDIRNDILDRPGKNTELLETAAMLASTGVRVQCDLILGNPFDTAEVLRETILLLAGMPKPLKLNTYKMQYFPHYPFTQRALAAGHIGPDDLREEVVADRTLYNFIYHPVINRFDEKTVLENCVYLIPWSTPFVWWLALSLAKRHNLALAVLANLMAAWRYHLDFRANPALVWLRRFWVAGRLLTQGDLAPLVGQIKRRLGLKTA
ncbi:MAG: cobalamin-dependent protein [Magnetospirillum sp.]|nr:cobalamin-dependent protein [Magnetospirillum sp.]